MESDIHGVASGNQCDFMGNSWLWGTNEFLDSTPSLLFDLNDNHGYGKMVQSEPVSPSSVDTTPTSSELPIVHQKETESTVSSISVSKKLRKALPSPVNEMSTSFDRNGRKKKYDAPPGVWRNSGGFISTVYINKKRVYGPLRRDVNDAVRDREEMLLAKSVIPSEEGMRAFVQGMKERFGPNRQSVTLNEIKTADSYSSTAAAVALRNSSSTLSSVSAVAVRTSTRPVRAAAKRNVFVAFANDDQFDDDEEDTRRAALTEEMDASTEFDDSTSTNPFAFF